MTDEWIVDKLQRTKERVNCLMKHYFLDLPDWDRPSEGNDTLCSLFQKGKSGGLSYRWFLPETTNPCPLVLYLHGADVTGEDNEMQLSMHDIGTMFARTDWQKNHPCAILAPQYHHGTYWAAEPVESEVFELIQSFLDRYEQLDKSRIYLYGYSAGGVGTLQYLKDRPELFAAAVSICGATSEKELEKLRHVPLWMIHAEDDEIVLHSYGGTLLGSTDLYHRLVPAEDLHYTRIPGGYMKKCYGVNPHCSWVYMSDPKKPEIADWLFSHRK